MITLHCFHYCTVSLIKRSPSEQLKDNNNEFKSY